MKPVKQILRIVGISALVLIVIIGAWVGWMRYQHHKSSARFVTEFSQQLSNAWSLSVIDEAASDTLRAGIAWDQWDQQLSYFQDTMGSGGSISSSRKESDMSLDGFGVEVVATYQTEVRLSKGKVTLLTTVRKQGKEWVIDQLSAMPVPPKPLD